MSKFKLPIAIALMFTALAIVGELEMQDIEQKQRTEMSK